MIHDKCLQYLKGDIIDPESIRTLIHICLNHHTLILKMMEEQKEIDGYYAQAYNLYNRVFEKFSKECEEQ